MLNRAALEKPFPEELIKTRKGAFGKDLSYVEAIHYIRRLNDAFEAGWSWKIVSHEANGSEIIVHGVLEAGGQASRRHSNSAMARWSGCRCRVTRAWSTAVALR